MSKPDCPNCHQGTCRHLNEARKPEWAERLQRTFARKYDAGFAKGLMLGKAVGARDEQERIVKLLDTLKGTCDNDCDECRPHAERSAHYLTALQDLIKGEK